MFTPQSMQLLFIQNCSDACRFGVTFEGVLGAFAVQNLQIFKHKINHFLLIVQLVT